MNKPILVLCVDRDNDLFEKAKVSGPLVGRERNLEGATALAIADPEDPDSNAIFYAIKTYDKLRSENQAVELVTLTGDKGLGYRADREISGQLDRIIAGMNPSSCILISDGMADEEILPILKSRLKVDSTKVVFIKQAKELEKTYFVLLEKLRDPYYARILIGIPAILILLISLSSYLGLGLEPVGILIGLALILRIMGVDESVANMIKDLRFSFERTSWIGYLGALAILTIAAFVGYQTFHKGRELALSNEKLVAYILGNVIWIAFMGFLLIMAGKSIDALMEKKKFRLAKYMLYTAAAGLSSFVILVGCNWVANLYEPYVDFGTFLFAIGLSLAGGYAATSFVNWYRKEVLLETKIEGKEAISEHGAYIGKIVGIDAKRGNLIVQTMFDKRFAIPMSSVSSVDDNVVLKTGE